MTVIEIETESGVESITIETDFSKLTIGDIHKLAKVSDTAGFIEFADKVVVGGVMHLPAAVMQTVCDIVSSEFVNYNQKRNTSHLSDLRAMLEGVKGL